MSPADDRVPRASRDGSVPVAVVPRRAGRRSGARRAAVPVVVAVVAGAWVGPVVGAVAAMVAAVAMVGVARHRNRRSSMRRDSDVAMIFELAARSVRAGVAVPEAVEHAALAAGGPAARLVRDAMADHGGSGRVPGDATVQVVTAVVHMVRGAAGGGARGLEAGATLLRSRDRTAAEVASAASHARASAGLLVVVPLVFAGLCMVVVPGSVDGVASDPRVLIAVVAGFACQAVGAWWTGRLIRAVHGSR